MCRAVVLNGLLVALIGVAFSGVACGEPPPLVTAFDRFVPHEDVELPLGGSLLLSELSCTACHKTEAPALQPKGGPRLQGAGRRLQTDWVQQFLASPQTTKPGTTMPDMLAGFDAKEKQHVIDALAAFLDAQQEPFPVVKATGANPVPFEFWNAGDAATGKQLYHQVGCVACHEPAADYETAEAAPSPIDQLLEQLDPEEIEEMGLGSAVRPVKSVPHGNLAAKYTSKSLTFFLLNPEKVRPSGRMPSLKLKAVEAADIVAYLLKDRLPSADEVAIDSALHDEGKRFFVELGCANCHTATGVESGKPALPLAEIQLNDNENCLFTVAKGRPHYSLDEIQTQAIAAALAGIAEKTSLTAEQGLQLHLLQLNCYGCHERNELGGVGRNRKAYFETVRHVDLGDEGRLPPPLSGVGRKLTGSWLKKVLDGDGEVRPHVVARMPKFPPAAVAALPKMLASVDRNNSAPLRKPPEKPTDYVAAGRVLLDTGCVECHSLRGESLPGVVGIDLEGVTSRVEYGWFHEFLLNPAKLKSRTRMPTFFPNGLSQNKNVLAGDTDEQIAAIWHYLREIGKHPLPEKIEKARSQDFELVPVEKPILLRTFMPEAGTHALAVGFKEKVHFAFDTERLRLVQAWRGRFLDAQGTWFERFTPPAVPLGEELIQMPDGVALAVFKNKDQPWPSADDAEQRYQFQGFRLNDLGVPTLLYRVGGYEVQDRIAPDKEGGLTRRLSISADEKFANKKLWLRANAGKKLRQENDSATTNEAGLSVVVSDRAGQIRTTEGISEWLLPVEVDNKATIEVQYRW